MTTLFDLVELQDQTTQSEVRLLSKCLTSRFDLDELRFFLNSCLRFLDALFEQFPTEPWSEEQENCLLPIKEAYWLLAKALEGPKVQRRPIEMALSLLQGVSAGPDVRTAAPALAAT